MVIIKLYQNDKKVKKFKIKLSNISETMKINISIMIWINRVLMVPFLITLCISILKTDFFIYSMCIAFLLGFYQFLSFFILLFSWNKLNNTKRKGLIIYIFFVTLFFLFFYLIAKTYSNDAQNNFLIILYVSTPISLSLFWTYILEMIKKEI